MSDFTRAWANAHDEECEIAEYIRRYPEGPREKVACHCYRRWLEARLGEMPTIEDIEAVIINSSPNPAILARAIHALLPPKGAGE